MCTLGSFPRAEIRYALTIRTGSFRDTLYKRTRERVTNNQQRVGALLILTAIASAAAGCGAVEQARGRAEKVVQEYFSAAQSDRVSDAMDLYDNEFYSTTSRDAWLQTLLKMHALVGRTETASLTSSNVRLPFGSSTSLVGLVYSVRYAKGSGTETFEIRVPREGTPTILGHRFNANPSTPAPEPKPAA
jgi:hypothetical protein